MGIIYMITNQINGKTYVGQTICDFEKRKKEHRNNGIFLTRVSNGDNTADTATTYYKNIRNMLIYKAMAKYGVDNFTFSILEDCDDNQDLNSREIFWINELKSLQPSGYNLTTGGGSKYQHAERSIQLMKEAKLQNLDNTRHPILLGLPPCVTFGKKGKYEWILVRLHPLCNYRMFTIQKYGSIAAAKEAVRVFITELEASNVPYVSRREKTKIDGYPMIRESTTGFKVKYKDANGKTAYKTFGSKSTPKEKSRQNAIEWYENNIQNKIE